ncbi:MAG: nuclear transport factor 2 family protein [Bacteroidetes bacterium]|nr:nuclear transport factor 2 family protein [Bacteroidota bacterium]
MQKEPHNHLDLKGLLICIILSVPLVRRARTSENRAAVHRAVLNYVEGFYVGDPKKISLRVNSEVNKRELFTPGNSGTSEYVMSPMTFEQKLEYARNVRQSGRVAPASASKEIEIFDVKDKTASVKLSAVWGTDYRLLAKINGE